MAKFDLNNYVDVATRIDEFYKSYPEGRILTELLNVGWQGKQTQFIVKAYLYNGDTLLATGLAEESLGGAGANATSALETAAKSIPRATSIAVGSAAMRVSDAKRIPRNASRFETLRKLEAKGVRPSASVAGIANLTSCRRTGAKEFVLVIIPTATYSMPTLAEAAMVPSARSGPAEE